MLKKRCRRHGVRRWPHRKLKSLDKLKEKLEREEAVSTDKQYYQAEIHSIVQKKDLLFRTTGSPALRSNPQRAAPVAPLAVVTGNQRGADATEAGGTSGSGGPSAPSPHPSQIQAAALQHHTGAHPPMAMAAGSPMAFGAPAVSFCGIFGCDCFMTGGISSHGLHPPLSVPGRPPPPFYPGAVATAHVPVGAAHAGGPGLHAPSPFHYGYMPYASAHQHSHHHRFLQMRMMDPHQQPVGTAAASVPASAPGSAGSIAAVDANCALPSGSPAATGCSGGGDATKRAKGERRAAVCADPDGAGGGCGRGNDGARDGNAGVDIMDSVAGSSSSGEFGVPNGTADRLPLTVHQQRRAYQKAVGGGSRSLHERGGDGAQSKGNNALYAAAVAAANSANMHTSAGVYVYGSVPPPGAALQNLTMAGKPRENGLKQPEMQKIWPPRVPSGGSGCPAKKPRTDSGKDSSKITSGRVDADDVQRVIDAETGNDGKLEIDGERRKPRNGSKAVLTTAQGSPADAPVEGNATSTALITAVAKAHVEDEPEGALDSGSGSGGSGKGSNVTANGETSSPPPCLEGAANDVNGTGSDPTGGAAADASGRRPSQSPPTTDGFFSSDQDMRNSSDDATPPPEANIGGSSRVPAGPVSSAEPQQPSGDAVDDIDAGLVAKRVSKRPRARESGSSDDDSGSGSSGWSEPEVVAAVGSAVWTVDANGTVSSCGGAQALLDAACVPAIGRVLPATGSDGAQYARARAGERVEAVIALEDGRRFLQVLAALPAEADASSGAGASGGAGACGVVVAGLAVELASLSAKAIESVALQRREPNRAELFVGGK